MSANNSSSKKIPALVLASLAASLLLAGCGEKQSKPLTYMADIKPILDQHCVECHKEGGKGTEKSGLLLDSYAATMRGTKFGPVVLPGQAVHSTLYRLVSGQADPSLRMPHDAKPLPEEITQKLHDWIDQGAKEQ
jgi:hypothetical protein